jgi:hypothetical protein
MQLHQRHELHGETFTQVCDQRRNGGRFGRPAQAGVVDYEPGWKHLSQLFSDLATHHPFKLARSPEYRRCVRSLRTAIPKAFFCPTSTSSRLPRVIPV